ncbi:hypothetical protein GQ54DRAFT_309960 [Martensiomyces pterosporus]|nr:hypothetical protein GQ54DRAFT_309960 [Martensiomyces pterosporus]
MARFFIPAHAECVSSASSYFHPPVRKDVVLDISVKKLYAIRQAQRATHRQANLYKTVLVYNTFKAMVSTAAEPAIGKGVNATNESKQWQHDTRQTGSAAAECSNISSRVCCAPSPNISAVASVVPAIDASSDLAMDVDTDAHVDFGFHIDNEGGEENGGLAAAEAEQSWFDRCIDSMLTDDDQEPQPADYQPSPSLSADDSDDEEEYECEVDAAVVSAGLQHQPHASDDPAQGTLKRSPSSASIQSMCLAADKMQLQMRIDHPGASPAKHSAAAAAADATAKDDGWQKSSFGGHVGGQAWQYANLFLLSSVSLEESPCIY